MVKRHSFTKIINSCAKQLLLAMVKFYQLFISPYMAPSCIYELSCSNYALKAITEQGPFKGSWMTIKRLLTCHGWGGSCK